MGNIKTAAIYATVIGVHLLVLLFLLIPRGGPAGNGNGDDERAEAEIPADVEETIVEAPEEPEPVHETYRVQRGDNLTVIARRHGTTVAEIRSLNNLSSDLIVPDQELLIPVSGNSENNSMN